MRAALAADEGTVGYEHFHDASRHIACLACGETRTVFRLGIGTGECPRCHYVGWTYVDDLDVSTRRLIMNRALARRSVVPLRLDCHRDVPTVAAHLASILRAP